MCLLQSEARGNSWTLSADMANRCFSFFFLSFFPQDALRVSTLQTPPAVSHVLFPSFSGRDQVQLMEDSQRGLKVSTAGNWRIIHLYLAAVLSLSFAKKKNPSLLTPAHSLTFHSPAPCSRAPAGWCLWDGAMLRRLKCAWPEANVSTFPAFLKRVFLHCTGLMMNSSRLCV